MDRSPQQFRRLSVPANGIDIAPEPGVMGNDDPANHSQNHQHRRCRQPAPSGQRNFKTAELRHKGMVNRHGIQIDQETHPTQEKHTCQCDDKRLNIKLGNQHPHHSPECRSNNDRNHCRQHRMHAKPGNKFGHQNPDKGNHRADRQINPARQNDKGHANGCNDQKGIIGQKCAQNIGV